MIFYDNNFHNTVKETLVSEYPSFFFFFETIQVVKLQFRNEKEKCSLDLRVQYDKLAKTCHMKSIFTPFLWVRICFYAEKK